jgi:predicted ATP-binding protein involved in virulence
MKIKRLDIENFRGIRKMRIDFHPQLNVFAGKNGAGKTTVLNALGRAIEIAYLNHVTGNERQALESRLVINPGYIRVGEKNACIKLQFSLRGKEIGTTVSSNPEDMTSDLIFHFPEAGIRLPSQYFLEERFAFSDASLTERSLPYTTRFGWAFAWISEREDLENSRLRKFIDSGKEFGKDHFEKDGTLQSVKNAVAEITGFAGLFNDREKKGFTLRKRLGIVEEVFFFSQLSYGEQHLVAFAATIAVFLADSFPEAENPLHGEAVIMADAIEFHLHPSWQREIIPRLLAAFPNCQFIVTTHSPQVLGNVKPESVFILKETDAGVICEKPDESYGMTMDRLLELVMDDESRSAEAVRKQLEKLFEHISRKEFDKALDIVTSLKTAIPTDPDLIRAEMMLHRKGMGL